MTQTYLGYKIVKKLINQVTREEEFHSAVVFHRTFMDVVYRIGEKTYPRIENSGLFLYGNAPNAISISTSSDTILECEWELHPYSDWIMSHWNRFIPDPIYRGNDIIAVMRFWKDPEAYQLRKDPYIFGITAPIGTVLANWIRPIRVLE